IRSAHSCSDDGASRRTTDSTNGRPKTSRPVDFGGGRSKNGCARSSFSSSCLTCPRLAHPPSRSYVSRPPVASPTAASINAFPGPVSNARSAVASPRGGSHVRFAIPPMFWSTRRRPGSEKRSRSTHGTSGAPSPPAAMSRDRKSLTTGIPVRSAIVAASPSWSVCPRRPPTGGSCQTVWPWEPIRSTSSGSTPTDRHSSSAASASHSPSSACSRQITAALPSTIARWIRSRRSGGYGTVRNPSTRHARSDSPPSNATSAASIPSSEVPDMSPITRTAPRSPGPEVADDARDHAVRRREALDRLGPIGPEPRHHDRRLDMTAAPLQPRRRFGTIDTEDLHQDPLATVLQLLAGDLKVDHQVPIDLAQLDHRRGADRVQHHLRRGPGLHPRRARADLAADERRDHDVVRTDQLLRRIGPEQEPRPGAPFPRPRERAVDERRRARRRDPEHEVQGADAALIHRRRAVLRIVLRALLRKDQRGVATGDDPLDHLRIRAVRRRH